MTTLNSSVNTSVSVSIETITPEVAVKYLDKNIPKNRKVTTSHVDLLSHEMNAAQWMQIGDPVRFNIKGQLIDGQHRLRSVAKSGVQQEFVVIRGLPEKAIDLIDTASKPRSASDILSMHGVKSSNLVATTLIYLNAFYPYGVYNNSRRIKKLSTVDILDLYDAYHDLVDDWVKYSERNRVSFIPKSYVSTFGVLLSMTEGVGFDPQTEFLDPLCSGEALFKGEPVYELREVMISRKNHIGETAIPRDDAFGMMACTWNLLCNRKKFAPQTIKRKIRASTKPTEIKGLVMRPSPL